MTEKIEWYKEVLELEPNSKIFFPLARLLSEVQRIDEALDILEQGLERHPEFLEARLFFIELLYKTERRTVCTAQIAKLSKMFAAYAGFWQAWGASLNIAGDAPDTAFALRFLSAWFTNSTISIHDVLDRGLASLLDEKQAQSSQQSVVKHSDMPPFAEPMSNPTDSEPVEEQFSLRTRSMAEVLADQGDIPGALDIYHELLAGASNFGESGDLQHRITTLSVLLANAPAADLSESLNAQPESSSGKDKLISMLEALAERVEARAQS